MQGKGLGGPCMHVSSNRSRRDSALTAPCLPRPALCPSPRRPAATCPAAQARAWWRRMLQSGAWRRRRRLQVETRDREVGRQGSCRQSAEAGRRVPPASCWCSGPGSAASAACAAKAAGRHTQRGPACTAAAPPRSPAPSMLKTCCRGKAGGAGQDGHRAWESPSGGDDCRDNVCLATRTRPAALWPMCCTPQLSPSAGPSQTANCSDYRNHLLPHPPSCCAPKHMPRN